MLVFSFFLFKCFVIQLIDFVSLCFNGGIPIQECRSLLLKIFVYNMSRFLIVYLPSFIESLSEMQFEDFAIGGKLGWLVKKKFDNYQMLESYQISA